MAEAKRRLSYREYLQWAAYYQLQPWGDDWDQTAAIVCTQVNLWSKRKIKPWDVIPGVKQREIDRRRALFEKLKQQQNGDT